METPAFNISTPLSITGRTIPIRSSTVQLRSTTFLSRRSFRLHPFVSQSYSAPYTRPSPSRKPIAMSLSKVVIAGGTGFIGTQLSKALLSQSSSVTILTRKPPTSSKISANYQSWSAKANESEDLSEWEQALMDADLVVNLCGHPVVSRWTPEGKDLIVNSRVETTEALVNAIKKIPSERRPKCFIGSSAVGYYGVSQDAKFDETSAPAKGDYLSDVCVKWEKATTDGLAGVEGVRTAIVRIGVVMGVGGGALERMLPAFKLFVGGPVGTGQQWVPWVHIDDLVRVFIQVGEDGSKTGAFNATAPTPVTMGELANALGKALGRPSLFPVPGFVLKLAFGEGADVVLQGQQVIPKRLTESGFEFTYADIDSAMKAVADVA